MYYKVELIRPLFNSIYNIFSSDLNAPAKQAQISFQINQAELMIDGYELHLKEATPEQAQNDIKTLNDLLVKFSGMHKSSKNTELKNQVKPIIEKLKNVITGFEKVIEYEEDLQIERGLNKYYLDTWGGEDEDYADFLKMKRYEELYQ